MAESSAGLGQTPEEQHRDDRDRDRPRRQPGEPDARVRVGRRRGLHVHRHDDRQIVARATRRW